MCHFSRRIYIYFFNLECELEIANAIAISDAFDVLATFAIFKMQNVTALGITLQSKQSGTYLSYRSKKI